MLENLEKRHLLSSTLVGGLLTVTGSNSNDTIGLAIDRLNIKVVQTGAAAKTFTTAAVQKILINALNGNDKVTVGSTSHHDSGERSTKEPGE